ncbi:hypothetical protein ACQJBY_011895 [Aegilops geniculata]
MRTNLLPAKLSCGSCRFARSCRRAEVTEQSLRTLSMVILLAFLLLLFYGAGSIHCAPANHGNSTDMLALLDFKGATSDPTGALRSWDRSVHYCNWTGVRCSQGNPGRVAALQLPGESLSGEITPSLGNLTFLKVLNLSSNGFSGQLTPLNLNHLHELIHLDLSSNSFKGIIPDSLMNCSNMKVMDLSINMLEGPIPTKIGSLYNLLGLGLSRNNLSGVIPQSISNATQLEELGLQENQLGGSIPDVFGRWPKMLELSVGENRLSGRIPPSIFNLTSLQTLGLYANKLQGELPLDIGDTLPEIIFFWLGENMLEGHIPASLGNISGLQVIDFFFLEKEDDPQPLHLGDAYGHFIDYSRRPYKVLQTIYLNPPSWQHMPLLLSI